MFTNYILFNPLSANPTKWSNTLKQFVDSLPTNCCLTILWVAAERVKITKKRGLVHYTVTSENTNVTQHLL